MAWTYDPTTLLGVARLYFGDTNSARPLLSDAEVTAIATLETSVTALQLSQSPTSARQAKFLASRCAGAVASKLALDVTYRVSTFGENSSDKAKAYIDLQKRLLLEAGVGFALPYVGGRDLGEKATADADTSAVQPIFSKGMQDDVSVLPPAYDPRLGT